MSCSELACSYAALILHDDGIPITSEKIATLLKAANVNVESHWPGLFVKLAEKENIDDLILNVGKALLAPFLDAGGDKRQVPLTEHVNISFTFISEILSWLPVESLLRFKCASKQWFSLIDQDSNFIKLQSVRGSHSVLPYYQTKPDLSYLVPISTEDWKYLAFSGGLCLEQGVNSPLVARIRNPATHQVLYLPEAPKDTVDFSFACNPFSGQCKVVCTYNRRKENDSSRFGEGGVRFEVLTVGKDEQWRGMKHPNQDLEVGDGARTCVPFNVCHSGGVVHISEIVVDENYACVEIYHLDVLSESFTVTSLKQEGVFLDVIDLKYFIWDELLAVSEVRDVDIIVLVLEDFKQHKWSEPKIIPLDFLKNGLALKNAIFPEMSHSMELVFYNDDGGSFFLHDMESNKSQIIELEQVMAERLAPLKSSLVFIDGMKPE